MGGSGVMYLTCSYRMPYVHANILPIDNRRTFKHAFRFLHGWPGPYQHTTRGVPLCGLTCIHAIGSREIHGVTVRWPRTEGTANNERVHSFC